MTCIEGPLKKDPLYESDFASTANLILEFASAADHSPQRRAARRISLDGSGGLIVYGDAGCPERLLLNEIAGLRIEPARPLTITHACRA